MTSITESSGVVNFKFMGGDFSSSVGPVATDATDVSSIGFVAHWNAVTNSTAYLLDVFTLSGNDTTYLSGFQANNVGNFFTDSISNLAAGTSYYYRVRATNDYKTTVYSNVVLAKTLDLVSSVTASTETFRVFRDGEVLQLTSTLSN